MSGHAGDAPGIRKEASAADLKQPREGNAKLDLHPKEGLRDPGSAALDNAKRAAETTLARLKGGGLVPSDRAAFAKTLRELGPLDVRILTKSRELAAAEARYRTGMSGLAGASNREGALQGLRTARAKVGRIRAGLSRLQGARIHAARQFPLALRIRPGQTKHFMRKSKVGRAAFLRKEAWKVLADIRKLEANPKSLVPWVSRGLRHAAAAGFVAREGARRGEGPAEEARRIHAAWRWVDESLLAIGLAFGAASFAGSIGLLSRGSGSALALHGATGTAADRFADDQAGSAGLPPDRSLPPPWTLETPAARHALAGPPFREAAATGSRAVGMPWHSPAAGGWHLCRAAGCAAFMLNSGRRIFGFGPQALETSPIRGDSSDRRIALRLDKPLDTVRYSLPAPRHSGNLLK